MVEFKLEKTSAGARSGVLKTNHGTVKTPLFMPVGTRASVKMLSPRDLKELKSGIVLGNTYHLALRPGDDIVKKAGGLNKFMNYDGPTLTDSGGFQVFSLIKSKENITEEGVLFKNHLDGSPFFMTPEKSMEIQNALDSDIAMAFDECPPYPVSYEYMKESVERTTRWAKRCKEAFNNERQSLFGIVQGGEFKDLRELSAKSIVELNFDGYAIGGVSVGEPDDIKYQMIEDGVRFLPKDKVRYLMGVGEPIDLIEGVRRGIDIFDCVLPTRLARHAVAFTKNGKINLKNSKYKEDFSYFSECDCYLCKNNFSYSYLRHLFNVGELLGPYLLSLHNTRFLIKLMEDLRESIENDNFEEFAEGFISKYKNVNND